MPRLLHPKIQAFIPVVGNGAGMYSFPVFDVEVAASPDNWEVLDGRGSPSIRHTIIGDHRTLVHPLPAFGTMIIHGKSVELAARHP